MKLRYQQEWYYRLHPSALLEREFEDVLTQNSDIFAPECWVIPFRPILYANGLAKRPDYAIIDKSYSYWFVVEIEMNRHHLYDHVLPQVRTFRDAAYIGEHIESLLAKEPELDADRLYDLVVRGDGPTILVLADEYDPEWQRVLSGAGVEYMTLQLYRSERLRLIFAIDGSLPQKANDLVTHAIFEPQLPRFLRLSHPAALDVPSGEICYALWEGRQTYWQRVDTGGATFLRVRGSVPLKAGVLYSLVRRQDGVLVWMFSGMRESIDGGEA